MEKKKSKRFISEKTPRYLYLCPSVPQHGSEIKEVSGLCKPIYLFSFSSSTSSLSDGVATVHAEIGASDVSAGIRQQECDGAHQIVGLTHLTLGDKRGPLSLQVWLIVENLLSSIGKALWLAAGQSCL